MPLEVITGSMYSGKTEELVRRIQRVDIAGRKAICFKHSLDDRYEEESITTHLGYSVEAIPVKTSEEIFDFVVEQNLDVEVIFIDEVQFFDDTIIDIVNDLANLDKRVVVAGTDTDFRGKPFGPMGGLMATADKVDKLNAICVHCGKDACRNQRLIDGEPAPLDGPVVSVGSTEKYEARCRKCFNLVTKRLTNV